MTVPGRFSRRERQIMEILYQKGQASAGEVQSEMHDPPGYSAVRALLRILEEKGHVQHTRIGSRYVYQPATPRRQAAQSALAQVVQTFFGGSVEQAVVTLVSDADTRLSEAELDRLAQLIEQAKEQGLEDSQADGKKDSKRDNKKAGRKKSAGLTEEGE